MSQQKQSNPIFLFETSDPTVVHISISEYGQEKLNNNAEDILEDLVDNLDVSLRNAGYMYNITLDALAQTVDIAPYEGVEGFNQEVFDLIAEELQFSDTMVRGEE